MRRPAMWILALLLTSASDLHAQVAVRLYASDPAFPASPQALEIAATILGDAGVRVTWISCGSKGHRDAACDSLMRPTDLAVRLLVCDVDPESSVRALGYALIDTRQGMGTLATVYVDRVAALAWESRVDPSVVLGRAIAHEIGHLLMGTTGHSATGLMRALWSRHDLERGRPDEWRFTQMEKAAMRDRRGPIILMATR